MNWEISLYLATSVLARTYLSSIDLLAREWMNSTVKHEFKFINIDEVYEVYLGIAVYMQVCIGYIYSHLKIF